MRTNIFRDCHFFYFVSFLGYYTIRQTAQNIYTPCPEKNGTSILSTLPNDNRFSVFLPADLAVNFWKIDNNISHRTLNASRHYLVKY